MVQARIGNTFHKRIEVIKDSRLQLGLSKDRPGTEKISNMIIKHSNWKKIEEDIIKIPEEELNKYGGG